MTIMTTNVSAVADDLLFDIAAVKTRREADLISQRVLRASCSEADRSHLLSMIEAKRRGLNPLRSSRRVPN
jgi:hypothetical protein